MPLIIQRNNGQRNQGNRERVLTREANEICLPAARISSLVVPADGSNEIPAGLKSCQLPPPSLHPRPLRTLHFPCCYSRQTLLVRISRGTFRKEITLCRKRGKEKAWESYMVYQATKLLFSLFFFPTIASRCLLVYRGSSWMFIEPFWISEGWNIGL